MQNIMFVRVLRSLVISLVVALSWPVLVIAAEETIPNAEDTGIYLPQVVISEVQTGTEASASDEFVELYNNSDIDEKSNAVGWKLKLEYKSATGSTWTTKAVLDFEMEPKTYHTIATKNYLEVFDATFSGRLAAGGGHVRLLFTSDDGDTKDSVLDTVGWGNADSPEGEPVTAPKKNESIQRCLQDDIMVDTDNNADDFAVYEKITPGSGIECVSETEQDENTDEVEKESVVDLSCEGIVLSEVLPNAAGSDSGNEFIELYNPTTDFVDLDGCGLQLEGDDDVYRFADITLEPEEYRAFSDSLTGITLPNSAGGTVYLLSAADEELQAATYPGGLDDDVAWAWFGGNDWQQTYVPTPGLINVSQPDKPCPAGQVRNPDSGRCISTASSNSSGNNLKPCDPDQERNPETNRCRKISSASTLKPCSTGQERNPATNRCRSISSAASQLKPCGPDQERNPETNRCRKVAGFVSGSGSDSANVKDLEAPASSPISWWIAGFAGTAALAYGLWEWRRELAGIFSRRFSSTSAAK